MDNSRIETLEGTLLVELPTHSNKEIRPNAEQRPVLSVYQLRQIFDLPSTFNLEQEGLKRQQAIKQFIDGYLEQHPAWVKEDEVGKYRERVSENWKALEKEMPAGLRLRRQWAVANLTLRGVKNADAIIRFFEEGDIAGIQSYQYSIENDRVKWADSHYSKEYVLGEIGKLYESIIKADKVAIFKSVNHCPQALVRFEETCGYLRLGMLDETNETHLEAIRRLALVPDSVYQEIKKQIRQFPFLFEKEGQQTEQRIDLILPFLEKGGFTTEEQLTLEKTARLANIISNSVSSFFGTNLDEIMRYKGDLDDMIAVAEAGVYESMTEGRSRSFYSFGGATLKDLAREGSLKALADLVRQGWQMDYQNPLRFYSLDSYEGNQLKKFIVEATDFAAKLNEPEVLERFTFSRDFDAARGTESKGLHLSQAKQYSAEISGRYQDLTDNLSYLISYITGEPEERRKLLQRALRVDDNFGIISDSSELFDKLGNKEVLDKLPPALKAYWEFWLKARQQGSLSGLFSPPHELLETMILQHQLQPEAIVKDGRFKVATYQEIIRLKTSLAEEDFTSTGRKVITSWELVAQSASRLIMDRDSCPKELAPLLVGLPDKLNQESKYALLSFLEDNFSNWLDFVKDGQVQSVFFEEFAKKNPWIAFSLLGNVEVMAGLSREDRSFWEKWRDLPGNLVVVSTRDLNPWRSFWEGRQEASDLLKDVAKSGNSQDIKDFLAARSIFDQLPLECQTFLEVWSRMSSAIQDSYVQLLPHITSFAPEIKKMGVLAAIQGQIEQSSSKELQSFRQQFLTALIDIADPEEAFRQIVLVFERNRLPEAGKIYRVFEILYSSFNLDKLFQEKGGTLSPVLGHARKVGSFDSRYAIIYRDLLKVQIESANPNFYAYMKTIQSGGGVLERFQNLGLEGLDELERGQLVNFLDRMDMLYMNSLYGRRRRSLPETADIKIRIRNLQESLGARPGQIIVDRITEMFIKPLGYQNLDEAILAMELSRVKADDRNRRVVAEAPEQKLSVAAGDLLKGVSYKYLDLILRNGIVAKEFLGASAGSDSTPLDTDVGMVLESDTVGGFKKAIENSPAKVYGDLIFAVKDRGQFYRTDHRENYQYDKSRYELFQTGVVGEQHYGIRTGIPATEIDFMIAQENLLDEARRADLDKIFFDIAQNGFYIPVVDETGKIIFTPEQFEQFRVDNTSLSAALSLENPNPEDIVSVFEKSPYLKRLLESGVGVSEGYTLGQHTTMVLRQYERYFSGGWASPIMSRELMRLLFLLHDLGKPTAVEATESTEAQHEYTKRFLPRLLDGVGFRGSEQDIALSLIDQDMIGEFIKGNKTVEQTTQLILNQARDLGIPKEDFYRLLQIYYMCDAGSYTADAGGVQSLDYLFVFQRGSQDDKGTVAFSPETQAKIDKLKALVLAG